MNKFFTKIVGASLAIAMMIGVGAGLNAAKQAKEVNADAGESFQLVKDAATLSANDQIVIGSATSGSSVYLLSTTQNSNNRSATGTFTVSNDKVTLTAAVQVLTLGQTNSHWTFNTGSGYLYAASSSKNYLRTQTTNDTNGEWTISITAAGAATITAQGSNTHNKLKYNANNGNPIFSAYDSNGTVAIYKKVASSATVTSVSASIKDGTYYVGNHLSSSDFNVTVSWSEGDDTHPTSGFTWTVNGVANGTLNEGNNSVVLTYQQVNSAAFNVIGSIEHGTLENDPLSAGEAFDKGFALASKGETTTQYYIQGVVSEIIANQLDAENDKYATFWLQNGNEPHGFEAYQITAANGCTNYEDLLVGAEVLIKCTIYKFSNSVIETGSIKSLLSISYTPLTLAGVILNKTSLKLEVGKFETLNASPDPVGAELGDVTWETSDELVATVDSNGKVTGAGAGSATITATAGGFTATCDVTVELSAELDLTTDTTTSASADLLTWEVSNKFALRAAKEGASTATNNYYPGTTGKTYTSTRFYKDSVVTLTPDKDLIGVRAEFKATSNSYAKAFKNSTFNNATATLPDGDTAVTVTVTFTDGMKPFSVTIGGTCGFDSVKLFYTEKTAAQKVETNLTTNSELSYRYTKDGNVYTFTDINMRFGGYMSKDLWNELNTNENLIAGVGVMITGYAVQLRSAYSVKDHANEAVSSTGEFNIKTQLVDYYAALTSFSPAEQNNNYYWNLRYSIASQDDIMDEYTAAAYIKLTNGNLVFFKQVTYSVWSLAYDYLTERNCDENTAGGSLYHLFNDAGME